MHLIVHLFIRETKMLQRNCVGISHIYTYCSWKFHKITSYNIHYIKELNAASTNTEIYS
jgi:hypothetical protein